MTEAVKSYLNILQNRSYRKKRIVSSIDISEAVRGYDMSDPRLNTARFDALVSREIPVLLPDDIFGFHRHQADYPTYTLNDGTKSTTGGRGNITPNYARVIGKGLDATERDIRAHRAKNAADPEKCLFYDEILKHFSLMRALIDQYQETAERAGYTRLADALKRVPYQPAETFYEACLFMQIIIYFLRCSPHSHLTLGRFDQYMHKYYMHDIECGKTREELLERAEARRELPKA